MKCIIARKMLLAVPNGAGGYSFSWIFDLTVEITNESTDLLTLEISMRSERRVKNLPPNFY